MSQFRISRTRRLYCHGYDQFLDRFGALLFPDLAPVFSSYCYTVASACLPGCGTVPTLAIWGGRVHMGFPCHLRDLDVVEGPDRSDRARDILFDDGHLSHQFFGPEPDAHRGQPGRYVSLLRKGTAPRRDGVFRPVPSFCVPQGVNSASKLARSITASF